MTVVSFLKISRMIRFLSPISDWNFRARSCRSCAAAVLFPLAPEITWSFSAVNLHSVMRASRSNDVSPNSRFFSDTASNLDSRFLYAAGLVMWAFTSVMER